MCEAQHSPAWLCVCMRNLRCGHIKGRIWLDEPSQIRLDNLQHAAAGPLLACTNAEWTICLLLFVPPSQAHSISEGLQSKQASGC